VAHSIVGRVIDAQQRPVPGIKLQAIPKGDLTGPPPVLGEAVSDGGGRFSFPIEEASLASRLAHLGRNPPVRLRVLDASGQEIFTTRAHPIDWQLEFRIYLGGGSKVPDAPNLYAKGIRRMIADSRDAGLGSSAIKTFEGKDTEPAEGGWKKSLGVVQHTLQGAEIDDSADMMFAVLDGLMLNTVESTPVKIMGYDGAQVPRHAWAAPDNQAIIWPRKEPFKWD